MKIRNTDREAEDIKLDMTAMIDVVFQLLVFFVMTFKTPVYEGDFGIKMPLSSPTDTMEIDTPDEPMTITLVADENRDLSSMTVVYGSNTIPISFDKSNPDAAFNALQNYVIEQVGTQNDPSASDIEAEFDIDADLRYHYTVKAIEMVSGYRQGEQIVQLIEKINFKDSQ